MFTAPYGIPTLWRDYDQVPVGLPAALERQSHPARGGSALALPRPLYVLSAAESAEIQLAQPTNWWGEFRRRHPSHRQVLAFSPVAFSADSASALVMVAQSCDYLCGTGRLVWLEDRRVTGWRVRRAYVLWMN